MTLLLFLLESPLDFFVPPPPPSSSLDTQSEGMSTKPPPNSRSIEVRGLIKGKLKNIYIYLFKPLFVKSCEIKYNVLCKNSSKKVLFELQPVVCCPQIRPVLRAGRVKKGVWCVGGKQ